MFPYLFSTFLFFCCRDHFDLAQRILWQCLYRHTASGRFGSEIFRIYFVKRSEISHVRQEAGSLQNLVKRSSGLFQNRAYISAGLVRLALDPFRQFAGYRVKTQLPCAVENASVYIYIIAYESL